MTKEVMYVYLGTNGTICSPVHLEDIYYIRKIRLRAASKKVLTKDYKNFYSVIIVTEDDVANWVEVDEPGQDKLV